MFEQIITKEVLEGLYINRSMQITVVARELKTTATTIRKYMKKFKIPFRRTTQDLTGKRFGRLVAIYKSGRKDNSGKARWNCSCDCGRNTEINAASLIRGLTTSCGCRKHELCCVGGYKDISKSIWRRLIKNAKQRGYAFDITPEYVWEIYEKQGMKCTLSDLPVSFCSDSNQRYRQTASIDRIDSFIGYIQGNIQIVHKVINQMKSYMCDAEFISFCNLVADKYRRTHEDSISNATRNILRKV